MFKKGDYIDDAEFGVRRISDAQLQQQGAQPRGLERSDTHRSSGSVGGTRDGKYARSVSGFAYGLWFFGS